MIVPVSHDAGGHEMLATTFSSGINGTTVLHSRYCRGFRTTILSSLGVAGVRGEGGEKRAVGIPMTGGTKTQRRSVAAQQLIPPSLTQVVLSENDAVSAVCGWQR